MKGRGLRTENQFFGNIDDILEVILAAHDGLDDEASAKLNAKLVLILANHIGDRDILAEAISGAKKSEAKS